METEVTKERRPRPEGRGWVWDEKNRKWFRIRKLTPRECFRLMDVNEKDIDKMMSVNEKGEQIVSNSQLYKAAGNSIVVACMEKLFEQLWYPQPENGDNGGATQLTLW